MGISHAPKDMPLRNMRQFKLNTRKSNPSISITTYNATVHARTHARTHACTHARTHTRTHERAHTSVCARVCLHEHTQKFIYFLSQTKSYTRNGVFLCGAVNGANPMHRTESSCAQEPRALLSGPAAARSPCWRRKIAQTESAPHR